MTILMQAIQSFNHHSITTMSLHKKNFCNFLFILYADITLLCKVSFAYNCVVLLLSSLWTKKIKMKIVKRSKNFLLSGMKSMEWFKSIVHQHFISLSFMLFQIFKMTIDTNKKFEFYVLFLYVHIPLLHNKWIAHCID